MIVKSTVDYVDVIIRVYHALEPRIKWDAAWLMLLHAHTLVRPRKLASLLLPGEALASVKYAGYVRNASAGPQYLGYVPHVAHEHGILLHGGTLRRFVIEMKGRRIDHDFRAAEFGSSMLALSLWTALGVKPSAFNLHFASPPEPEHWISFGVTIGPMEASEMLDLNRRIWGEMRIELGHQAAHPQVALLTLVRESAATAAINAALQNWGALPPKWSLFFFVADDAQPFNDKDALGDHEATIVRMSLDKARPARGSHFYSRKLSKGRAWDSWLRHKVARVIRYILIRRDAFAWVVLADDDTSIVPDRLAAVLEGHDARRPIAVGRKFGHVDKGSLIGGGPGIAMSRAALDKIAACDCCPISLPIVSHTVPGGDGWLGQCLTAAGVAISDDWHFRSFPPFAFQPQHRNRMATFHRGVDTFEHSLNEKDASRASHHCRQPIYHWSLQETICAPSFTIIGAPKAGTTSLHYILGQHPDVALAHRKELNFWGSPWLSPDARDVSIRDFIFNYLMAFPRQRATSSSRSKLLGESSPDYLLGGVRAARNMIRFLPMMRLIVCLREPIDRSASAYYNKLADKSVRRYLSATKSPRLDDQYMEPPPSFDRLVLDVNWTLHLCPFHNRHYTMREANGPMACYVNPFVLHGYYAKYLLPWFDTFPANFVVVDFNDLELRLSKVMATLVAFLGVNASFQFDTDLIFNTRKNRGVHPVGSKPKKGQVVSPLRRSSPYRRAMPWSLDSQSRTILEIYYTSPNIELADLLARFNHEPPSWLTEKVVARREA